MPEGNVTLQDVRVAVLEMGRQVIDSVEGSLGKRLDAIDAHLQTLNGRVAKNELETTRHAVKLSNLEREVFRRRSTDHQEPGAPGSGEHSAFTRRDARMLIAGITGTIAVLAFLFRILPVLLP